MKKLLGLLLALTLLLGCVSFAEEAQDWGKEEYAAHAVYKTELAGDYTGKTVILHTNDMHGQIDGYAYVAGLRKHFEELGAKVILVDAGDFSQGTVYVSSTKGLAAIEMMNAAKYDAVTLGNHEFDYGYVQLMENLEKANFTSICCDVTLDETGATILSPSLVVNNGEGLNIAFVGAETPETATKVHPRLVSMITFDAFDKLYGSIQDAVDTVREGADLVIGLFHLGVDAETKVNGSRSIDVLEKVNGIDFVIDGHSHTEMTAGQNGEPIQSTGTKFKNIGVIVIDNESKGIEDNFLVPTYLGSSLYTFNYIDEEVAAEAKKIMDKADEEFNAVFATSEVLLNGDRAPGNRTEETNLGDLITDAMLWYVLKDGGVEQMEPNQVVCITNGGGIRAPIAEGDVTKKDINTVLPFGNTVAVAYVTGAELLEILEASTFCTPDPVGGYPQTSGIVWTLDTTKAYDQGEVYMLDGKDTSYFAPASINRVTISEINGEPFDPEATYAVVTNNFCSAGGDTYNVLARSTGFDTGIPMDEAVMAYISEALGGKITAEAYAVPRGHATQIK